MIDEFCSQPATTGEYANIETIPFSQFSSFLGLNSGRVFWRSEFRNQSKTRNESELRLNENGMEPEIKIRLNGMKLGFYWVIRYRMVLNFIKLFQFKLD